MKSPINVGVVGATGVVGEAFLNLLESRKFPFGNLKLFASERSTGIKKTVGGKSYDVEVLSEGCFDGLQIVFFSSGDDISKEWAPKAMKSGAYAIDNSASFRMNSDFELVVPEINGTKIPKTPTIIANPNCSTIQLVMALNPLKPFGLKSVRVASYQAVSGAGAPGQKELSEQLQADLKNENPIHTKRRDHSAFTRTIAFNCIPQIGSFNSEGFSSEESKVMNETKKILDLPKLLVSAFTVRVPVWNTHSEAVWIELEKEVSREAIIKALKTQPGLSVDEELTAYSDPRTVSGENDVFVGRIQQDSMGKTHWRMWIVGDNLLKGAALNGIQIAETLI